MASIGASGSYRGAGTGGSRPDVPIRGPASPEDVDKLQHLLQVVVRMFYEDAAVMILDQVMRFRVIPVDLLAGRLGVTPKDLKTISRKLLDDQLIVEDGRSEYPAGAPNPATLEGGVMPARMRPQRRYYYLFDPHFAFVAIKWRIGEMYKSIEAATASVDALTTRGYICPQCHATFTSFDAARLFDPNTNDFRCETPGCYTELRADEDRASAKRKEDKMKRFNEQFRYLLSILPQLDAIALPSVNLEEWLSDNGPNTLWKAYDLNDKEVQALERGDPVAALTSTAREPTVTVERDEDGLAIASGTNNTVASGLQVDVSAVLEPEAALQRAKEEAELKAKTAESNALPAWHLTSTVSGEKTSLGLQEDKRQAGRGFWNSALGESGEGDKARRSSTAQGDKAKDDFEYYASVLEEEGNEEEEFEEVDEKPVPHSGVETTTQVGTKRPPAQSDEEPDSVKRQRVDKDAASHLAAAATPASPERDNDEEEFEEV